MTPRTRNAARRGSRAPVASRSLALLTALALPATLGAQIIRVPSPADQGRPIHVSANVGFLQSQDRFDGQSGTAWRLGEALTYRATVDVGIRAGALGLTGAIASVPIQRIGGSAPPGSDGDIQLRHLLATFRTVETDGFHQIIEVGVGLAQWASYSGTDVLTADEAAARNAFALLVGYGFGFPVGERFAFTLVQDFSTLWGSAEGLPAGQSRSVRQFTTRLGLRYRLRGRR